MCIIYAFLNLIALAGDVENNPGPEVRSLRILQINARSLKTVNQNKNKLVQFKSLVATKSPHIVSICETWLNKTVEDKDILSNEEYKIYRKDRDHTRGGGVFLAISSKIKSKRRKDLESKSKYHNEMIVCEAKQSNGKKICIVSAYKPPDDLNYEFAHNLKHILRTAWDKGMLEILLLGDFNFPEINWETGYPRTLGGLCYEVAEAFQDYGLDQLNIHPSRDDSDNILDLILSNHPHKVGEIECYHDILSTDHAILDFTYEFHSITPKQNPRVVYNFRRANFEALNEALHNTDWQFLEETDNLDESLARWENTVKEITDRFIPKIRVRDMNTTPWIDGDVIHLSNKKETKRRKAKRTGRQRHWAKYREYNQRLQNLIHRKFNNYVANCTGEINDNPRKFWTLVGTKTGNRGYPDIMKLDNESTDTDQGKATLFNTFFGSVFTLPDANEELPEVDKVINPYLENIVIEEREVETALKAIDPTKATGPDNISSRLLKECAESLAYPLTRIFNASLKTGKVPSSWKQAKVCPVFKKGEKCDIKNYRPISLLAISSKILERCIFNRIIGYIDPQITDCQHGFTTGRSTVTQLLEAYDNISKDVENRKQVDALYLDLSKAFDSVSYPHLLIKLQWFGINGKLLAWFKDYLTGRTQRTGVNGAISDPIEVISGVPQGSILGPLLFIMFINDMPHAILGDSKISLYADDSKIFKKVDSYHDCMDLQQQLDHLVEWSKRWRLNFNASKCKIMSITRKILPFRYQYHIAGTPLERVTSMNDLGILVQDNLLWDDHIRRIVGRANRNLFFIKRAIGEHAPFKAKMILYTSLVRSQLEYGSTVWAPITKQNIELLERVQRRGTKYICNYQDLTYKERLLRTKLVPLTFRREMLDCQFAHKARSGILGTYVHDICSVMATRHNARLDRDNTKIQPKLVGSETYSHYYTNRLPHIWNSLPGHIRKLAHVPKSNRFKSMIKDVFSKRLIDTFDVNYTCTWVTKCRCPTCRI